MSIRDAKEQRMNELLRPINEILIRLEDESLSRSHNSVYISFGQMLTYIDEIRAQGASPSAEPGVSPGPEPQENLPKEIKLLLQTFRDMAQRFYTQYEFSLLEEINKQQILQREVPKFISVVETQLSHETDAVKRNSIAVVTEFLKNNADIASGEHAKLTGNFSTHMQAALDKLRDEWQRLHIIVTASQTLNKDERLLRALGAVGDAAAYSVGINTGRIMILPGSSFAIYFFAYLENFAVLTVPIYSMRAPWEWSIFWHELAGYQVRQLDKYSTIVDIREKLKEFHRRYKELDVPQRETLLNKVTRNHVYEYGNTPQQNDPVVKENLDRRVNQFSLEYLKKVFSGRELTLKNLEDLGGLGHQFERILDELNIPKKERLQRYEEIRRTGWSVDWIKELFEDAWSVLAIREPFLDFFKDVLDRHNTSDGRHPEPAVRLRVAREILNLLDPDYIADAETTELEKIAARQILSFISLLIAASYQFEKPDDLTFNVRQEFRNSLPELVGTLIGKSIMRWSGEFIQAKGRGGQAAEDAETVIEALSDEELTAFINNLNLQNEDENNLPKPSYEDLLENKDYKNLLNLPFFERDFLNSNKIRNVRLRFGVNANSPFSAVAETVNFILPANTLIPGSGGDISFDVDGQTYHTSKLNWNEAFKLHPEYRIL